MSGKEFISEIIVRHFDQTATAEEEAELAEWLLADPANQATFDLERKIWTDGSGLAGIISFDKNKAWIALENKIENPGTEQPRRRPQYMKWIAAAAMIISLAVFADLYYNLFHRNNDPEQILAGSDKQKITMPDGSVILLGKGSSIQYARDFPKGGRSITLKGEAYFNVQHDENNPFRIEAGQVMVEVLGTSFLVRENHQGEQIFVTTGKVKVTERADGNHSVLLTKGELVSIIGKIFDKDSITDNNYLFLQTGVLEFEHVPLKKMIETLNQNYQSDIEMSESLARKSDSIRVNFRFEKYNLNQVLDEIHEVAGWKVERSSNKIILREQ